MRPRIALCLHSIRRSLLSFYLRDRRRRVRLFSSCRSKAFFHFFCLLADDLRYRDIFNEHEGERVLRRITCAHAVRAESERNRKSTPESAVNFSTFVVARRSRKRGTKRPARHKLRLKKKPRSHKVKSWELKFMRARPVCLALSNFLFRRGRVRLS